MIIRSLAVVLSLCVIVATAYAHGPARGPNGGQMQDLAGGHVELVAHDNEIAVYLFDAENKPMSAQGVVATATVLFQGKQEMVMLQPADGNVMRGRGVFLAQPGLKVVVSLTLPGQRPQLGRYAPLD
ncbi:MAG: hypothetical protein P9C36_01355 [Defluviicoccus sp.]|nr:hypothetical protein [Defluviicoccus sp.]MDG4591256.1 hypothetical protein [Defluviicoccus sp.]